MITIFILGMVFGIYVSVLFLWCIVTVKEEPKRYKVKKMIVTEHWYSKVSKQIMHNHIN